MNEFDWYFYFPSTFKYCPNKIEFLSYLIKNGVNYSIDSYNVYFTHSSQYVELWCKILRNKIASSVYWYRGIHKYQNILKFCITQNLLYLSDISNIINDYFEYLDKDTQKDIIYYFCNLIHKDYNIQEAKYAINKLKRQKDKNGDLFNFLYILKD